LSGIIGILQRDGAPVDTGQLQRLTALLEFRGPDALNTWVSGVAGLGHTLLRTRSLETEAAIEAEWQPARLDEPRLSITADARLDARGELRAGLCAAGRAVPANASDPQLILEAYAAWGAECIHRLRGDFAFAIWDEKSATLFCARDHFGIKPFYYAAFDELFLCCNTLQVLLAHPRVSGELNESAVGDFLLFGLNCDNATTTFRDIQRLPPGHALAASRERVQLWRYWDLPINGRIRYSRAAEYVEHFRSVFDRAVEERLDRDRVGVLLSGGLDSAAVASTGKMLCAHEPRGCELRGYTVGYAKDKDHRDRTAAGELARALGIPAHFIAMDALGPFAAFDESPPIVPEPVDDPMFASLPASFREIARDCRVLLSGEGSDNLIHFEMWPYAADLRRSGEYRSLVTQVGKYAWRRPFPWRGIQSRAMRLFQGAGRSKASFPKWIARGFAERLNLEERWSAGQPLPAPPSRHPIHPISQASLSLPQWTRFFELENCGVTRCPIEVRYPFLDLRVVEYLFSIPPFPWFFEKAVLREAMAGRVPEAIRLRPKIPYAGDPFLDGLRTSGPLLADRQADRRTGSQEVSAYISPSSLTPLHGKMNSKQLSQSARPYCFKFWLQSVRRVRYN
jgi:asparagine synthase (glutamine-hydrolysing)